MAPTVRTRKKKAISTEHQDVVRTNVVCAQHVANHLFQLDRKRSELDEDGLMRIFTATLAEHGVLEDYEPPRSKYAKKSEAAEKVAGDE